MKLSLEEQDVLKELINIGVGKAAGVLNQMTGLHITMIVPFVTIALAKDVAKEMGTDEKDLLSAVHLGFSGNFSGSAALVFPTQSASTLVAVLIGEEPDETDNDFNELRLGALNEVGNIVINGVMGSVANVLSEHLDYTIPTYLEGSLVDVITSKTQDEDAMVLIAQTHFTLEERDIEGEVILTFDLGSFDALLKSIHNMLEAEVL
ncbi:chemotaxis protein CheC [Candidatus Magnetomoraceae bacterium gMMP-1]